MAYSINRGLRDESVDNTQRSLLIGLPAIALVLSFGAIKHHANTNVAAQNAKTIPVVSSLSSGENKPGGNNGGGNTSGSSPSTAPASSNVASSPQASSVAASTSSGSPTG